MAQNNPYFKIIKTMVSQARVSNYLQYLNDSLEDKLIKKSFEIYPFERTYEDNPKAIGKERISSQLIFTGLDGR
ncbi:MAG: hypothetical protein F6K65_39030, partial [Moorea sp. SIO3C2]|nr:hypothetical protein [Moorena sp. SIO3C2]